MEEKRLDITVNKEKAALIFDQLVSSRHTK